MRATTTRLREIHIKGEMKAQENKKLRSEKCGEVCVLGLGFGSYDWFEKNNEVVHCLLLLHLYYYY